MPEAPFRPKAVDGYNAVMAMEQLPIGTKFVNSAYLDNFRRGSGSLRIREYTVVQGGIRENIRHVFRRFDEVRPDFLYTVIESAEGEVYYRAGETRNSSTRSSTGYTFTVPSVSSWSANFTA